MRIATIIKASSKTLKSTHDVVRDFKARQILDILMLGIDDIPEISSIHHLGEHPHLDLRLEIREVPSSRTDYTSYSRAPEGIDE